MGQTNPEDFGNGGTIDGDLVVSGDLQVSGGGSLSFDEIVQGTQVVEITNTEALLVRKASDGGDVFIVDTTNSRVGINQAPSYALDVSGSIRALGGNLFLSGANSVKNVNNALNLDSASGQHIALRPNNGSEKMRIDSSTVIIGTHNSNAHRLAIESKHSTVPYGQLVAGSSDQNQAVGFQFTVRDSNGDERDKMFLTDTGLGIGIAPAHTFHVHATSTTDNEPAIWLHNNHNASNKDGTVISTTNDGSDAEVLHVRANNTTYNNGTSLMLVRGDGNIGIGTSSPAELVEAEKDQNAHTVLQVDNNTAGTGASGGFKASADGADLYMRAFSSSFTTSGRNIQDAVQLLSVGASGGFVIASTDATADMSFWTANTQRVTIDGATGNVGIGTSSPQKLVHLDASSGYAEMRLSGSSGGGTLEFYNDSTALGDVYFDTNKKFHVRTGGATTALTIDENQNIGIGNNSSPVAKVDIVGDRAINLTNTTSDDTNKNASITHSQYDSGTETEGFMLMQGFSNSSTNRIDIGGGSSQYNATEEIKFHTASNSTTATGTERMVIDNSGNVGIGGDAVTKASTFGDATTLGIVGTDGSGNGPSIQVAVDTTADARPMSLVFFNKNNADTSGATTKHIAAIRSFTVTSDSNAGDDSGGILTFHTKPESGSFDERMRIDSSGNVGIGTAAPTSGFDKNITIKGTSPALILVDSTGGNDATQFYNIFSSNGNIKHFFDHAGSLNFATTTDVIGNGENIRFKLDDNSRISLSNNDSGTSNTVFGKLSGDDLQSTGTQNSFFGENSGHATTTGDKNVAIGYDSLFSNTIASSTVSVGRGAGRSQTDHGNNVYIGDTAGYHQTGESNVFIGKDSGLGASGSDNDGTVAVGYKSLEALVSGSSNVAVGYESADEITTGANNTVVGYGAMSNADSDESHNVCVGNLAGDDLDGGDYNVVIGSLADAKATGQNQTVIGYNAQAGSLADNSVVLGNGDVTAVYMAQDSGATVHAGGMHIEKPNAQPVLLIGRAESDFSPGIVDNDILGELQFAGHEGSNTPNVVAKVLGVADESFGSTSGRGELQFQTGDESSTTTKMTITSSGVIDLPFGQLKFPATQNASADANTLDDYEEGTWTPLPADASSGGNTASAGTATGHYTKIGRIVHCEFTLVNINTTGMTSGNDFFIQGLPFAVATHASHAHGSVALENVNFSGEYVTISPAGGTSAIRLAEVPDNSNIDIVMVSEINDDSADIYGHFTYMA
ncbi:hypothetical protein [uncultured Mediterranean phage uvMED]|nr:hypothetical protein [uncultured Mediterranean phage uvMED]